MSTRRAGPFGSSSWTAQTALGSIELALTLVVAGRRRNTRGVCRKEWSTKHIPSNNDHTRQDITYREYKTN
jgi:hypothetical protein